MPGPVGSGGTLNGVTLNGNLDLSATNANATVLNGLTLNGTATVGAYADLYFLGSQTFGGVATVLFLNEYANALIAGSANMTLTLGPKVTVHGGGNQTYSAQVGYSTYWGGGSNTSLINEGTIIADTAGMAISLEPQGTGTLTNTGTLSAVNSGTLNVRASVIFNGQASLSESPSSSMQFTGNLLASTTNVSLYEPQGTVTMQGAGTSSAPEFLEAMSADLGSSATGFTNNFAYGTLVLANNTYVKLVNQSANSPGSSTEAVYANSLVVPAGCTLNLNGLNLYVRDAQIAGTVTGGSITQIPNGGALNVTNATTGEDVQTTSGLVITPNAADVGTVTGFQITNITGGSLFLNDGVTPVTNGEFISVAQGAAGLKFTPTTGSLATGSFTAEESATGTTAGLIPASTATATITVLSPTPSVTNATTGEDEQTTSGLVVSPGTVDASIISNFKIAGITGGTLFLNDGVTQVTNGEFITEAQGAAGLRFTPTTGSLATGSFTVQDSIAANASCLVGVTAAATITVQAPTPTVTNATTGENVQSSSGLVIAPGAVDTSLITYFQITRITGGSLFLSDGVTPIANSGFITVAQGAAGLRFTPTAGSVVSGSFTVRDALAANAAGLLGTTAKATVTVLASSFENVPTLLHGVATVAWSALGYNPATITVDISAYQLGQTISLVVDQPLTGSTNWNTASVPGGQYELRAVMHDASGNVVGQCQQQVRIINTAAFYSGKITTNETWTSAQVNVVSANVTIPSGVTVTVQAGAIVKFLDGTGITIQSGGTLNAAPATSAAPVIFTSLEDDTAGGDTNMDGSATLPVPGDWSGIAVQGSGSFLFNQTTQVRYQVTSFSGTLAASQTWLGTFTYEVPTELTIPSGVTLTIQPGTVVKFGAGSGITVQSGGHLIADGTVAQPIIFTSINDGSFGGDTNGNWRAPPQATGGKSQSTARPPSTM